MPTDLSYPLPLATFFAECQQRVDVNIRQCLIPGSINNKVNTKLNTAMEYATLSGGKRIRPILTYASAVAVGAELASADNAACAVELIHCYSLVHDDLPAMDDDDLRRGAPTVHKAFDEGTAILVGDALQTLAFQTLAANSDTGIEPSVCLNMIEILTKASGFDGMVAGQSIDFESVGKPLDLEQLQAMHALKTGALIIASVEMGALSSPHLDEQQFASLQSYAANIGLAYQVHDDILDVTADTAVLGKPQGSDLLLNKPTYTSLLGLDAARLKARELADSALADLEAFSDSADYLRQIANYIVQRAH